MAELPEDGQKELKRVAEATVDKFAVAGGGRVKRTVTAEYAGLQEHVRKVGGFEYAERLYAAPIDTDVVTLPSGMKVHNVEWVADGAAQFIQAHGSPASSPFFLYIGWTLPHGPDADKSLREAAIGYTPAGTWKMNAGLQKTVVQTRNEVRKRAKGNAEEDVTFQGHKSYSVALSWLDRWGWVGASMGGRERV